MLIFVQVASSICQSVALLLLIPLLGTVGVGASSSVARSIREIFHAIGLRPTLVAVLCIYVAVTAIGSALSAIQSVLAFGTGCGSSMICGHACTVRSPARNGAICWASAGPISSVC